MEQAIEHALREYRIAVAQELASRFPDDGKPRSPWAEGWLAAAEYIRVNLDFITS